MAEKKQFQSTLCVCRATLLPTVNTMLDKDFNPRSAYAERRFLHLTAFFHFSISIHAPRMQRDSFLNPFPSHCTRFQSTLRVWSATANLTKLQSVFSNTFTNFLSQIYLNVILCCIFVSMKLYFLHVCRCESHCIFVCTSHSHLQTHHGVLYKINLNQWLLLNKSRWF